MTWFHRFVAPFALLCALPLPAHAADGTTPAAGRNPAAAQALFEEAQRRVAAGDYEEACPKFKASYALDAAGGTLLNLADCLEKQGRTASAWSHFKDALVQAQRDGRSERVQYAQRHIRALEPQLAYLTVQVPAASNVGGLTLHVDGTELVSAAWGTALPVDPGTHLVRAEAPGFEPFEQNVTLGVEPGAKQTLLLPPLRAVSANELAAPASESDPMQDTTQPGNPARTWAWITGGVGVVALGVGSYFGLRAYSLWDEREAGCESGCTSDAKAAGDDAEQAATLATVSMSAGVALLATATVLFIVSGDDAPDAERGTGLSLTPTDRGATLSWGGQF